MFVLDLSGIQRLFKQEKRMQFANWRKTSICMLLLSNIPPCSTINGKWSLMTAHISANKTCQKYITFQNNVQKNPQAVLHKCSFITKFKNSISTLDRLLNLISKPYMVLK